MSVSITFYPEKVRELMQGATGPVARECMRRAQRVESAARRQVGVRSGRLRANIVKRGPQPSTRGSGVMVLVGSTQDYALLHHEGTRPHIIRPVKSKSLVFTVAGVTVFTQQVNHPGTRPNHYLTDNLKEALR